MTIAEFLAPVGSGPQRELCLAVLYYYQRYREKPSLTVEEIRAELIRARVPKASKINAADVLNKSGAMVDSPGVSGSRRLWQLTTTGEAHIRAALNLPAAEPEIEHDVATLGALAATIGDVVVQEYILEAIKCLSIGALRAAIVFLWTGAIRTLQEQALTTHQASLNAAISKHDPKARQVNKLEDFAYVRDATALLAFQELGILDKGEKATLGEALDLRNRCGHPTKYVPGIKKASSFIEDVVGIVFA
ncbi:conserved hypothetical protein [Candidatus Sulfotelmatobacter sp. SbA7]|jgi:hypothetical protein|nr:conserved hypothetical protein [Candidatus Sulfotelmatobacter sp. SbA7]